MHRAAILAAWADHLRSRGDLSRRYELMRDEARQLAADTGQVRLMRTLDTPTAHAAGLTPREIDVLRLISRGRSNRDIAAELRITENTAANHVRSILIKTGAANRTQVAMMAVSRRWVDDHGPELARPACRYRRAGHPAGKPASDPSGSTRPLSSMTASAGKPALEAARRIASASGASYRQYVFRLSADKKE